MKRFALNLKRCFQIGFDRKQRIKVKKIVFCQNFLLFNINRIIFLNEILFSLFLSVRLETRHVDSADD